MFSPFDDFFNWLLDKEGEAAVIRAVVSAMDQRRIEAHPAYDRETYLDIHGMRGQLGQAVNRREGIIHDKGKLLELIHELRLEELIFRFIIVPERNAPWDVWRQGSEVVVILAGKYASIAATTATLRRTVIGIWDFKAHDRLLSVLQKDARIEFEPTRHFLPPDFEPADADRYLHQLCRRRKIGAIVVLGSPLVNPLTDAMARMMFSDVTVDGEPVRPEALPARLRWSFDLGKPAPFLSEPRPCGPEEEGVVLRGHRTTTYPRMRDEEVTRVVQGRPNPRGVFPDCGILALSVRQNTNLILCAGHGGCGTMAAVLGLSRTRFIESRLLDASDPVRPTGLLYEPLWVNRRKATALANDDFRFDEGRFGQDWGFAVEEEDLGLAA